MLKAMSIAKDGPTSQAAAPEAVRALDSRMQQAMQGAQAKLTVSARAAAEHSLPPAGQGAAAKHKSQRRHDEWPNEAASAQAAVAYLFRLEYRAPAKLGGPVRREPEQPTVRAGQARERWAQHVQHKARQPAVSATLPLACLLANHEGAPSPSLHDAVATQPLELPSAPAAPIKPGEPNATPMASSVTTPVKGAVAALASSARKAAQPQAAGRQHAVSQKPSQASAVAAPASAARAKAASKASDVTDAAALALVLAPLGARLPHPGLPALKAAPTSGRRLAHKARQAAAAGKQDGPLAYHFRSWGAGRSVTISQATRADGQSGYALQASDAKVERLLLQQLAATPDILSQPAWLERGDGQQQRQRRAPEAWDDEDAES